MDVGNSTCSVRECSNKALRVKSGICSTHYERMQKYGNLEGKPPARDCAQCGHHFQPDSGRRIYCSIGCSRASQNKTCAEESCSRRVRYNGKCEKHAHRDLRREVIGYRACDVCGETYGYTYTRRKTCSGACSSRLAYRTNPDRATRRSALSAAILKSDYEAIPRLALERSTVNEEGCWIWPSLNQSGYPIVSHGRNSKLVHRIVLEAKLGGDLGRMEAHHICGIAACVNPAHLQQSTKLENILEMRQRRNLVSRVKELEEALKELAPGHVLLKL